MCVAEIILASVLLAQASDDIPRTPPAAERRAPAVLETEIRASSTASDVARPAGVAASNRGLLPPDRVAAAMAVPAGGSLAGQPLTLVNVLSSTPDRRQQLELTQSYWSLVQAVAEYHFCIEHVQRLSSFKVSGGESPPLKLGLATATAMLRQAELEVLRVQYDLARSMRMPVGAALPLPADRPHVGPYRTSFQELFAGRVAPESAALMDRVLPIRRQAVEEHAVAIQAAEDAIAAVAETPASRGDVATTIACSQALFEQQKAFIRVVCDYNRGIAEYGLTVAAPMTNPQSLVAMLIGPSQASGDQSVVAEIQNTVQPAAANIPATARSNTWRSAETVRGARNEPTLAPPRDSKNEPTPAPRGGLQPLGQNAPALTPPQSTWPASHDNAATPAPPRDTVQPASAQEPSPAPQRQQTGAAAADERQPAVSPQASTVPIEQLSVPSTSAESRTTHKPASITSSDSAPKLSDRATPAGPAIASQLYPALVDAGPAARVKQLAVALYWDRSLPEGLGTPMTLADCLVRDPNTDRRATIEAYWRLSQRAAEYQVLVQKGELLDSLTPVVLERRGDPTGPADMLRLRWAQSANQAAIRESHSALIEAQYALARRIGITTDASWPLASTLPHWGAYLLKLESQPKAVVDSWPVRRLAATIPTLFDRVQQHAVAVVAADAARVLAAEKYQSGRGSIDELIGSASAQTEQTIAVLDTLTEYNRAIADYVITVLPPATPADRLVAALVLKP